MQQPEKLVSHYSWQFSKAHSGSRFKQGFQTAMCLLSASQNDAGGKQKPHTITKMQIFTIK